METNQEAEETIEEVLADITELAKNPKIPKEAASDVKYRLRGEPHLAYTQQQRKYLQNILAFIDNE